MDVLKKTPSAFIPYEEALAAAGSGWYTYYVMLVGGVAQFSGIVGMQVMSIVLPVAGCDLGLNNMEKGILNSIAFWGLLVSSFIFGLLSDVYGRRKVMVYCSLLNTITSLICGFAPNFLTIIVIWFISGFLLGGIFTPGYVYVSEFCPQNIRGRSMLLPSTLGSLASVYLSGLAWLILPWDLAIPLGGGLVYNSWRFFLALVALPMFMTMVLVFYLPESPKFDLNMGHNTKTLETLKTIFAINKRKDRNEYPIQNICLDTNDTTVILKSQDNKQSFVKLLTRFIDQIVSLCSPPLLIYTMISCYLMFAILGSYNTLYLWFPEQMKLLINYYESGNDYNLTMCGVMSLTDHGTRPEPGTLCNINRNIFFISMATSTIQTALVGVISIIADRAGRKLLTIIASLISLASCLSLIFLTSFSLTVLSDAITVVVLFATFPIILSFIVDYFPTSLRSTATAVSMLFSRFGAALGSQLFGAFIHTNCEYLYWGIVALLTGSTIICIFLPSKRI